MTWNDTHINAILVLRIYNKMFVFVFVFVFVLVLEQHSF